MWWERGKHYRFTCTRSFVSPNSAAESDQVSNFGVLGKLSFDLPLIYTLAAPGGAIKRLANVLRSPLTSSFWFSLAITDSICESEMSTTQTSIYMDRILFQMHEQVLTGC
jgi:hypothetical protein